MIKSEAIMFVTYILYSKSLKKFYTGHTEDLDNRLNRHNAGKVRSTRKGMPWKLVTFFKFDLRSEAATLELKVKKRGAFRYLEDIGFSFNDQFGV